MQIISGNPPETRGEVILDRRTIKILVSIVIGAILFNWALQSLATLAAFLGYILKLIFPFLLGLIIALILNVPMRVLEKRLFRENNNKRFRPLSLLLTIVLVLAAFLLVLFVVIPEIVRTVEVLIAGLPGFFERVTTWGNQLAAEHPNIGVWLSGLDLDWDSIKTGSLDFLKNGAGNVINSSFGIATSVFYGVFNLLLGIVFAVYILLQKENLGRQANEILYAYLPEAKADRVAEICALINKTFSNFLTGQCLDALILGLMVFLAMIVFRFPYAVLIAVLVTCTAIIPVLGSFIACLVGAFLILVTSPVKAFWFLVVFLVLQQIEGNLIYPRVVGNSVGLPAIWVLTAVVIGGNAMGLVGMLISIPLFAVVYVLLRESVGRRLADQHVSVETPLSDQDVDK